MLIFKNGDMDVDGLCYFFESLKFRIEVLCVFMGFWEYYIVEFKVEEWWRDKLNELYFLGLSMIEVIVLVLGGVFFEMVFLKFFMYWGISWFLVFLLVMGLLFGGFNKILYSLIYSFFKEISLDGVCIFLVVVLVFG